MSQEESAPLLGGASDVLRPWAQPRTSAKSRLTFTLGPCFDPIQLRKQWGLL